MLKKGVWLIDEYGNMIHVFQCLSDWCTNPPGPTGTCSEKCKRDFDFQHSRGMAKTKKR